MFLSLVCVTVMAASALPSQICVALRGRLHRVGSSLPPLHGFAAQARASGPSHQRNPLPASLVLLKIICTGIWLTPSNQDLRYALYSEQSRKEKGGYSDEGYGLEDTDSPAEWKEQPCAQEGAHACVSNVCS